MPSFRFAALLLIACCLAGNARAESELSILTLNLWHWKPLPQAAVPVLLAEIDDLPVVGAGGPDILTFQEASLPLLQAGLLGRGYSLVWEDAITPLNAVAKLTASKAPPYHARARNRSGQACSTVCDYLEMCTLVGTEPLCVINVHSQAWQTSGQDDLDREQLSATLIARARELARGGFRLIIAGDFNAPSGDPSVPGNVAQSIQMLRNAGFVDAWIERMLPPCTPTAPLACTLVANDFEENVVGSEPGQVPDHRRIDYLFDFRTASGDSWQSAEVRFDGGLQGPRVSGQNGVLGAHGGPGAFQAVSPIGEYDVSLACTSGCTGIFPHRMSIESWDPISGAFQGTGFFVDDPSIRWTVAGSTSGSTFSLTYTYLAPHAGFVGTAAGSLDGTGAPATGTGSSPSHALAYGWTATRRSPVATYAVEMTLCAAGACPGTTNLHTMVIDAWNPATGLFSGRGRSDAEPQKSWTLEGIVRGTRFELDFEYHNVGAGYAGAVVGSIDPDGRLRFGLGQDNAIATNRFAFHATAVPEPSLVLGIAVGTGAAGTLARRRPESRRRAGSGNRNGANDVGISIGRPCDSTPGSTPPFGSRPSASHS